MLTWLSGNDPCPLSGENERSTVWPHLTSCAVLEVSVSQRTEKFALCGVEARGETAAGRRKEAACQMGA